MQDLHENFAAIAVMAGLYESGKDMYDVLAAYLRIVIQSEQLDSFTSAEITERINKTNSFHLNESIVKTSLKRLGLNRNCGIYSVNEKFASSFDANELEEQTRQNRIIVERLVDYIASEIGEELTEKQRHEIENQFYQNLKDPEYSDTYSIYINKFLMMNDLDSSFHKALVRIKEGLLVYEGICFSPEVGQAGKWEFPLDIFLEQEILFFIAGYNGEIHKEIYGQLVEYVAEINLVARKSGKKLIRLFYTKDVKLEIESYFNAAMQIFEKHEVIDPSGKAMQHILEGVSSKSDIQLKKVQFYSLLQSKGIFEKEIDFYSEENKPYNSVSEEIYQYNCKQIDSEKGDDYVIRCTDKINQINILRKNKNASLQLAKCVLLTANGTILRCAYMPNAYTEGDAPKAVNIDYLINRFWYKLNKGFGKGETPRTIDIISRAQMVLASMTVLKVSKTYEDIKQKYANGAINATEVAGMLSELYKVSKNPEEITGEGIDEQIAFLRDYDLAKKIEDFHREQIARKNDQETIKKLQMQLKQVKEQSDMQEAEYHKKELELEERIVSLENRNMITEDEKGALLTKVQDLINRDRENRLRIKRIIRGVVFALGLGALCFLLFIICNAVFSVDKSLSGIISIVLTLVFQFFTPMKRVWGHFVMECKLKEDL